MDAMADLLRLLYARALVLYFILYPAWTLSVDIMVNVGSSGECVQPVICKQDVISQTWSLSVVIVPNDLFALGRSVGSIEGDINLLSSLFHGGLNYTHAEQGFGACSVSCSIFLSEEPHLYLQSANILTKAKRQTIYDTLSSSDRLDTINQGICSLLSRETWKTHILFASSYEVIKAISSIIKPPTSKLLVFNMDNTSQLNHTLDSVYMLLERTDLNFIVVCSITCIVDVLNQVYQFETMAGMISNTWLMIPTTGSVADIANTTMQIPDADIVVMEKTPYRKEYSVLSWAKLRNFLSSLGTTDLFRTQRELTDYMDKLKPLNGSSVIARVHKLKTVLKKGKIRQVGHISEDGDVVVSEDLFTGFKYGFKNRTLTVSTLEWPPFVMKKEENGSTTFYGMCIDLLQEISRVLNFSYHIKEPEDREWGRTLEPDGRWTGLVGQMAYKKADIAIAPLAVMGTREYVMDFTVPYFYAQSAMIMKKPDPNANKWLTLVVPFRYEVHICIIVSLIFSTLFLFIVEEKHPINIWMDNRLSARWRRYGDILWYHFGALTANGGSYLPSSQTGRSVLSCWWLFTVICAAVYSGNLIAFLTDWREKTPFNSLEEMVEQDTYKWGTLGGAAYIDLFKNSDQPLYKKVWHGMQIDSDQTSSDIEVHISRVLKGYYAYFGDETLMQLWKSNQCNLHVLNDSLFTVGYAIGLPNNSAYTSIFSEQVLRINELGLPRVWYKEWSSSVNCETSRSVKRVDLLGLQSAFYASGVGVLLSLTILMVEVTYSRKCRQYATKNRRMKLKVKVDCDST